MFQESFLRFGGRKSPREARLGNATREAGEERGPPHTIEVSQDISHLTSVKIVQICTFDSRTGNLLSEMTLVGKTHMFHCQRFLNPPKTYYVLCQHQNDSEEIKLDANILVRLKSGQVDKCDFYY